METIVIMGIIYGVHIGIIGSILGEYRDNGKENGNCYSILGLHIGKMETTM